LDHGPQILARGAALLGIGDLEAGQAGDLVRLALYRDTFHEVAEAGNTGHFRDDRVGVGIPVGHHLATLDLGAVGHADDRAVGHLVQLALAAELIDDADLAGAGDRHQVPVAVGHGLDVVQLDG